MIWNLHAAQLILDTYNALTGLLKSTIMFIPTL